MKLKTSLSITIIPIILCWTSNNGSSYTQRPESIVSRYKQHNWLNSHHATSLTKQKKQMELFGMGKKSMLNLRAAPNFKVTKLIKDSAKLAITRFQSTICKTRQELYLFLNHVALKLNQGKTSCLACGQGQQFHLSSSVKP